jgi:hypothetical protein
MAALLMAGLRVERLRDLGGSESCPAACPGRPRVTGVGGGIDAPAGWS